jgi:hypothetical protein
VDDNDDMDALLFVIGIGTDMDADRIRYAACGANDIDPGGVDPPILPDDAIAAYIAICDGNAAWGPDGNGEAATASNAALYAGSGNDEE